MNPILIFRHVEHEGPGYLQNFLSRKKIPFELICIDSHHSVPNSLTNISGLIFMGGPMSVNDSLPWMKAEINLIRKALENDMPVLGHCLGAQLIAKAMGAPIMPNIVTEIGWHTTKKVPNLESEQWLGGLQDDLELFHWHSESFSLPIEAVPILRSTYCENQGFVKGNTLALQCHIEMTEQLVIDWISKNSNELVVSDSIQSSDVITEDLSKRVSNLNKVADYIYDRWVSRLEET